MLFVIILAVVSACCYRRCRKKVSTERTLDSFRETTWNDIINMSYDDDVDVKKDDVKKDDVKKDDVKKDGVKKDDVKKDDVKKDGSKE